MFKWLKKKRREPAKCRFISDCPHYDPDSVTCNDNSKAANYYGVGRPCGSYREMLKNV